MRTIANRLLPLGAAIMGLGGALTVGYLLYTFQDKSRSFWEWPGVLGVIILGLGLVALFIGFFIPSTAKTPDSSRPSIRQKQKGGARSQNFQGGRDVRVKDSDNRPE